jgi:hypothetical protein
MASKRCSKCGLVNPATAERCDCGRSFVDGTQGESLGQRMAKRGNNADELRREATVALRRARGWILGVGIMMFLVDQVVLHGVYGNKVLDGYKLKLTVVDFVILAFFVGMFILARYRPLAACVAALAGFWCLHFVVAAINPASLFQGLLIKALFTIALIGGIKSAKRAETLMQELGEVFE